MFNPEQLIYWSTVGAGLFTLIYSALVLTFPIGVFRKRVKDNASTGDKLKAFPRFYWNEMKKIDLYFGAKILTVFTVSGFLFGGIIFILYAGIMVIFT